MSTQLEVYAIDFTQFKATFGCKDVRLIEILKSKDDEFSDLLEEKDELSERLRQALLGLINGNIESLEGDKFPCEFGIRMLLEYFGTQIEFMIGGGGPSIPQCRKIDPILVKHGFPNGFSTFEMIQGGIPAPYPRFNEPEFFGHLEPEIVQTVLKAGKSVDVMGCDGNTASWVIKIISWIKRAGSENKGLIFVGD